MVVFGIFSFFFCLPCLCMAEPGQPALDGPMAETPRPGRLYESVPYGCACFEFCSLPFAGILYELLSGDNGGNGGDIDETLPDMVLSGRSDSACMLGSKM